MIVRRDCALNETRKHALPGELPAHGTLSSPLAVRKRTPIGVFAHEATDKACADLVPWNVSADQYPLLVMQAYVVHRDQVLKLVVTSLVAGPETSARGYALAKDWAKAAAEVSM